jgi:putative cardiolipin synthase
LGVVIESAALAQAIEAVLAAEAPERAYQVRLDQGKLQWVERVDGKEVVHLKEPETTSFSRCLVWFLSKLPIDWLL